MTLYHSARRVVSTPLASLRARRKQGFPHWPREQSVDTLGASIRAHDLDPSRRTAKWKEAKKLADYIADALQARLARGSASLGRGSGA